MPRLTAREIAAACDGELVGAGEASFADYHFDSRQVGEETLFFALVTPTNDGHRFLPQVAAKRGAGAVVLRSFDPQGLTVPLIRVDDTAVAYRTLAAWVRQRWSRTRYVAITGSAGKTTTREFAQQLLSRRLRSYSAPGNWNNWQGLPFALLKMPDDAEAAVFELAMSDPGLGEIDHLADLLRPDITCILNALPVHLEFLKTVSNVARGKLEVNNHLASDGIALVNGDFPLLVEGSRRLAGRKVYFGRQPSNDVTLKRVEPAGEGLELVVDFWGRERAFRCPPLTDSQVDNLLAAILIATVAGVKHEEIAEALADLTPLRGRGSIAVHRGITVVDETYNSNPEAAKRALAWTARTFPGFKAAVLGDMMELGTDELAFHAEVGRFLAPLGFDLLVTVGERARATADGAREAGLAADRIHSFAEPVAAGRYLREHLSAGSAVLLKASRAVKLEKALAVLVAEAAGGEPA